jgi:hypothetical protein
LEIVVLWEVVDAGKTPRTRDDTLNKKGRRGSLANSVKVIGAAFLRDAAAQELAPSTISALEADAS